VNILISLKEVKKITYKDEEPFFTSKYFYRPICAVLIYLFYNLKISPNTVTLLSLCSILGGALAILSHNPEIGFLVSTVLIQLYVILDHVDGMLKRLNVYMGRLAPSFEGEYFDLLVHPFSVNICFFTLGLSLFIDTQQIAYVLLGFFGTLSLQNIPRLGAIEIIASNEYRAKIENHYKLDELKKTLFVSEKSKEEMGLKSKIKNIVGQIIVFPGAQVMLPIVLIIDYILYRQGINLGIRGYYLALICLFLILNVIRQSYRYLRLLKQL